MSVTDYAIIRERLDHPQQVVWDPCEVRLPATGQTALSLYVLPLRTQVRLGIVAVVSGAIAAADAEGVRGRQALHALRRWLCGELPSRELAVAAEELFVQPTMRAGTMAVFHLVQFALGGDSEIGDALLFCTICDRDSFKTANRILTVDDTVFRARWWARCRALLPIANVTTAEIEWGDISLPPMPLADELPGDGGGA